jgi:hypothetical protein
MGLSVIFGEVLHLMPPKEHRGERLIKLDEFPDGSVLISDRSI